MDEGHIFHYEFHEHESGTFDLYLDCVRGDTMKVEPDPVPEDYEGVEEQIKLAKVYLFAVEIEDSLTMNVITEALLQSIWKLRSHGDLIPPHPDLVEIIWGKTVEDSRMRQMILDVFLLAKQSSAGPWPFPTDFYVGLEGYPMRFLSDLLQLSNDRSQNYHEDREPVLSHGDSAKNYLEEVHESEDEDENEDVNESEYEDSDEDEDEASG